MELFRIDLVFFFCWSSKTHGTGREGFYFSKLFFFLKLFLKNNRRRKIPFGGSNIRVLEARGLAGLAGLARLARLVGVAGRRVGTTKSNTLDAQERSADFCDLGNSWPS